MVASSENTMELKHHSQMNVGFFLNELAVPAQYLTDQGYTIIMATPSGKVPVMDAGTLKHGYRAVLDGIYSAKAFTGRVITFLKTYRLPRRASTLEFQEVLALFRSIWVIGLISPERKYYWKLFFWSLFNDIRKFPLAITFSIYGYHFRKVNELHVSA